MDKKTVAMLDALPIAEVVAPVRIVNHLENAGLIYVGELLRLTFDELRAIPNLGTAATQELLAALAAKGIFNRSWGMNPPKVSRKRSKQVP